MSRQIYFKSDVHCCTCQFWDGPRSLNPSKNVIIDGNPKGICTNPKGSFKGKETSCTYKCVGYFEKWNQLP